MNEEIKNAISYLKRVNQECAKCGATHIHSLPQNFTYLEIK